jgi:hypothetical protein
VRSRHRWRLGKTELGKGMAALSKAVVGKAVVKLTNAARRVLGKVKKRRTSLSLASTVIDPAGNSAKRRLTFTLPRM